MDDISTHSLLILVAIVIIFVGIPLIISFTKGLK